MNEERTEPSETPEKTKEPGQELVYESSSLPMFWVLIPALLLIAYGVMSR